MSAAAALLDFEPFLGQARAFLGRFHCPARAVAAGELQGAFASQRGGVPDLYGAADAAYALFALGELEHLTTPDDRGAWAKRLQAFQDPASGWFVGPRLRGHGVPHATAFATGALVLLGSRPAAPLVYGERLFASRETIEAWLDGLRWNQVWTGSHRAGAAAALLDAPEGVALPDGWGDTLLDALDARVDPTTGFWKRSLHDRVVRRPTALDLGGAAHFWWLYERLGRPLPHAARVVDGILGLQRRSGLWGSRLFGGAFPHGLDLDALHGLRAAWHSVPEPFRAARRARLDEALARYARRAHAMLTPPGSVERWLRTPHKLVGTLNALAELDAVSLAVFGEPRTRAPLCSALARVCWQ